MPGPSTTTAATAASTTGASHRASPRSARATEPTVHSRRRSRTAGCRTTRAEVTAVAPAVVAAPASTSESGDGGPGTPLTRAAPAATAVTSAAARGVPLLGVCGGYQMLAATIRDEAGIEAPRPTVAPGLGLLPIDVSFDADKHTRVVRGAWRGHPVESYEIHHGVAHRTQQCDVAGGSASEEVHPFLDGWQRGAVFGTTWHGAFENDGFRREFLAQVAASTGREWTPTASPGFRQLREQMLERLADAVVEHLDTEALRRLLRL